MIVFMHQPNVAGSARIYKEGDMGRYDKWASRGAKPNVFSGK
jgi:hypothetical protein